MHSNINIVTDNNYFFIGIKEYLHSEGETIRKIHPCELKSIPRIEFVEDDIFIFYTSRYVDEFSFLITADSFPGKIIIIPINNKEIFNIAFKGQVLLPPYSSIGLILNAIAKVKNKSPTIKLMKDSLTQRERMIILHTINGMTAQSISKYLSISIKTVYAHRRNALHKLGGRNFFEILPMRERILRTQGSDFS